MPHEFYTYFHTRNDSSVVFYVGKGKGKRLDRVASRNEHWHRIVAKCGHTVHIAERFATEEEAFANERMLIASFRSEGISLCNMTDGGEGVSGWVPSAKTRAAMSDAKKGVPRGPLSDAHRAAVIASLTGIPRRPFSDAHKAAMSAAQSHLPLSAAHKAAISASLKGIPISDANRAARSAARVIRQTKKQEAA